MALGDGAPPVVPAPPPQPPVTEQNALQVFAPDSRGFTAERSPVQPQPTSPLSDEEKNAIDAKTNSALQAQSNDARTHATFLQGLYQAVQKLHGAQSGEAENWLLKTAHDLENGDTSTPMGRLLHMASPLMAYPLTAAAGISGLIHAGNLSEAKQALNSLLVGAMGTISIPARFEYPGEMTVGGVISDPAFSAAAEGLKDMNLSPEDSSLATNLLQADSVLHDSAEKFLRPNEAMEGETAGQVVANAAHAARISHESSITGVPLPSVDGAQNAEGTITLGSLGRALAEHGGTHPVMEEWAASSPKYANVSYPGSSVIGPSGSVGRLPSSSVEPSLSAGAEDESPILKNIDPEEWNRNRATIQNFLDETNSVLTVTAPNELAFHLPFGNIRPEQEEAMRHAVALLGPEFSGNISVHSEQGEPEFLSGPGMTPEDITSALNSVQRRGINYNQMSLRSIEEESQIVPWPHVLSGVASSQDGATVDPSHGTSSLVAPDAISVGPTKVFDHTPNPDEILDFYGSDSVHKFLSENPNSLLGVKKEGDKQVLFVGTPPASGVEDMTRNSPALTFGNGVDAAKLRFAIVGTPYVSLEVPKSGAAHLHVSAFRAVDSGTQYAFTLDPKADVKLEHVRLRIPLSSSLVLSAGQNADMATMTLRHLGSEEDGLKVLDAAVSGSKSSSPPLSGKTTLEEFKKELASSKEAANRLGKLASTPKGILKIKTALHSLGLDAYGDEVPTELRAGRYERARRLVNEGRVQSGASSNSLRWVIGVGNSGGKGLQITHVSRYGKPDEGDITPVVPGSSVLLLHHSLPTGGLKGTTLSKRIRLWSKAPKSKSPNTSVLAAANDEIKFIRATHPDSVYWYKKEMGDSLSVLKADPDFAASLENEGAEDAFKHFVGLWGAQNAPVDNMASAAASWADWAGRGFANYPRRRVPGKGMLSGSGVSRNLERFGKLVKKYHFTGANAWLEGDHPISELRQWNPEVNGKATDMAQGWNIFGPKIGEYSSALAGNPNAVAIDRWVLRTFARWTGTPEQDELTKSSKDLASAVIRATAEQEHMTPAEVQSAMWTYERELFAAHGQPMRGGSLTEGAKKYVSWTQGNGKDTPVAGAFGGRGIADSLSGPNGDEVGRSVELAVGGRAPDGDDRGNGSAASFAVSTHIPSGLGAQSEIELGNDYSEERINPLAASAAPGTPAGRPLPVYTISPAVKAALLEAQKNRDPSFSDSPPVAEQDGMDHLQKTTGVKKEDINFFVISHEMGHAVGAAGSSIQASKIAYGGDIPGSGAAIYTRSGKPPAPDLAQAYMGLGGVGAQRAFFGRIASHSLKTTAIADVASSKDYIEHAAQSAVNRMVAGGSLGNSPFEKLVDSDPRDAVTALAGEILIHAIVHDTALMKLPAVEKAVAEEYVNFKDDDSHDVTKGGVYKNDVELRNFMTKIRADSANFSPMDSAGEQKVLDQLVENLKGASDEKLVERRIVGFLPTILKDIYSGKMATQDHATINMFLSLRISAQNLLDAAVAEEETKATSSTLP